MAEMTHTALASILRCLNLSSSDKIRILSEKEVPSTVFAAFFRLGAQPATKDEVIGLFEELSEFGECIRALPDPLKIEGALDPSQDFFLVAIIPQSERTTFHSLFTRPWIERFTTTECLDRSELSRIFTEINPAELKPVEEAPEILLDRVRSFILSGAESTMTETQNSHPVDPLIALTLPEGFRASGVASGIKPGKKDLGILISDLPCHAAGRFTQNRFCSAPVLISKEHLRNGDVRAVVVNSGNSNAATGAQGYRDARIMAELAAQAVSLEPSQIAVCSTGVIGRFLPMERVEFGIREASQKLQRHHDEDFLEAIMTTDAVMKSSTRSFQLGGKTVHIGGVTKGAGMIHPNMATMLAFLTTDAAIRPAALDLSLGLVVQETFNCLTVDGDTSTSDSVLLFANGAAGNEEIGVDHPEYGLFVAELRALCQDLVRQMARDGEGATHLVQVVCDNAFSRNDALEVAKTISGSLLVKTALFGRDPNWGRIICAVGNTSARYQPEAVRLWMNGLLLFENGMATDFNLKDVAQSMAAEEIEIRVDLAAGPFSLTVYTCDLTYDYVRINAEYTT